MFRYCNLWQIDGGERIPMASNSISAGIAPFVRKALTTTKATHGLTLCLVIMHDGSSVQLYAKADTLGQEFLDNGFYTNIISRVSL